MRIAIVGAGFSGAYLSSKLTKNNLEVTLFEKSRGVGGRMSTRYTDEYQINIGCPELTPVGSTFKDFCQEKKAQGILQERTSGTYSNEEINTLLKNLIQGSQLVTQTRIEHVYYENNCYQLVDSEGKIHAHFDALFITIPAPQLLEITFHFKTPILQGIEAINFDSVATMVLYGKETEELSTHKLSTLPSLRKLYQPNDEVLVIHMNRSFSNAHAHLQKEQLREPIDKEIQTILPSFKSAYFKSFTHLWKYGFTNHALEEPYRFDCNRNFGIVADWMVGARVEDAYSSVEALVNSEAYHRFLNSMQLNRLKNSV